MKGELEGHGHCVLGFVCDLLLLENKCLNLSTKNVNLGKICTIVNTNLQCFIIMIDLNSILNYRSLSSYFKCKLG